MSFNVRGFIYVEMIRDGGSFALKFESSDANQYMLFTKIFRTGTLLSLVGIAFGFSGAWRPTSLRWHAPMSGIATLAFWFMAATGE